MKNKPFDAVRARLLTSVPAPRRAEPQERSFEKLRAAAGRLGWSIAQLYRMSKENVITIYSNGDRGRVVLRSDVDRLIDAMVAAGPAKPHPSITKALTERLAKNRVQGQQALGGKAAPPAATPKRAARLFSIRPEATSGRRAKTPVRQPSRAEVEADI